jgi:stage V sporulation protein B
VSSPVVAAPTEDRAVQARAAGRGGVAVLGAKVFFIVASFVQQVLLARAIGEAGYGALSRVLAVANIPNNVVVSGSTQGVSRVVARARGHEAEAFRATLRVHVPLAVVVAGLFLATAPVVIWMEKAPQMTAPLFVLAGVVLMYGLYAPLIGSLNGRGLFTKQASLDVTFAIIRTAGMVGLGYLFVTRGLSGALGASVGFVIAAACIVPIAIRSSGLGRRGPADAPWAPKPARYLLELLPMSGAQLFTNLLMQSDISILGRFTSEGAMAAGLGAADADRWVAYYRACQLFAFLPYQLLFSITQVLFPMLARAKADGDREAVKRYVAQGSRLGAIACGLLVSVIAALPGPMVAFAYPADYAPHAAHALRVLALGQGAFAVLGIALTILTSLGYEWGSAGITLGALGAVVVACWLRLGGTPLGDDQLLRTATATASALAAALVVAVIAVRAITGAFVPALTAIRVLVAVAACVVLGMYVPHMGKLMTPILAVVVAAIYLVLLIVTRELRAKDLEPLRAVLGRKRA